MREGVALSVASPDQPPYRPSLLPIAAGIIEFAIGYLAMALPRTFDAPAYSRGLAWLPRYASLFIAGGILTLLSYATKHRWPRVVPVALAVPGVLPLALLSAAIMWHARIWPATTLGLLFGAGVIVDAVRPLARPEGRWSHVPTIAVVAGLVTIGQGFLGFVTPASMRVPHTALLGTHRVVASVLMFAATAALITGWLSPRRRAATQVLAAIPLALYAAGFGLIGRWPGAATYGLLAVFLGLEPWLQGALRRRLYERDREPALVADYEVATEVAAWGFVMIIVFAGAVASSSEARFGLVVLAAVTTIFTLSWFHFRSVREAGLQQTVVGSAVYSFFIAIFVSLTGGIRSPLFFVYLLPIIALAWTRAPKAIAIPVVIPLSALLTEGVYALYAGRITPAVAIGETLPRAGGLVLVSAIAYMLARRNLDDQNRTRAVNLQLQAVLGNMDEGLVTVDATSRITLCNEAARSLLGTRDDVAGRPIHDILALRRLDGTPMAAASDPVRRALAGQKVPWERLLVSRAPGTALAVSATPLADSHGTTGAIVLLRDVRTEIEMERLRDDFFFIASHELRTPLTIMKGNLEIAAETAPEGVVRQTIAEALASVMRLIRMVNDYLDAARLEHGTLSMRVEEGHLADLVRQAVETIRPDADRKGLAVTYRETPGLPAVRLDLDRTLQILLNLLGNSLRYTAQGHIEVWHEVHDGVVETLVRDTGAGIAPEHHARLFTRFGQVERGLTRGSGGSGLGLYISQKLAEQMGGTVVLTHSVPGEGSTFALRLMAAGPPERR